MRKPDAMEQDPIVAGVVHRSLLVDQPGQHAVVKLMLNLAPGGRAFVPGADVGILPPDGSGKLRLYTIEAIGEVPFEESIDITLYVRDQDALPGSVGHYLIGLARGDQLPIRGPFPYPFYPPMGSRSNMVMIGAGCGMVPFRWLAREVQARRLDWMGKVLMLEGEKTGLEQLYLNEPGLDQDQYFDNASYRAFEALKTRYSATVLDRGPSADANMDAFWRLLGQGSVFVYLAGYRRAAAALDAAMAEHLRLPGRWEEAKSALVRDGHWLELLYD